MDTHFSVEVMTNQKIRELRKEAELNRLLNQTAADRQNRSSFTGRLLSWIFRKPDIQQDNRQIRTKGTA